MAQGSTDTRSQPSGGYPVLSCRPPKGSARAGFPHRVGVEHAPGCALTGTPAGTAAAHLGPGQRIAFAASSIFDPEPTPAPGSAHAVRAS